ncbi:hypothetical protein ACFYPC_33955 [Streptomyces sp. NPDC005808]|uniref:hypothetical protein n=1 Tax=Streptomyces sp. NPDC005808 TaxID=3364734 RepID=UPI003679CF21
MAKSENTTSAGWTSTFLSPDHETEHRLKYAGASATDLVACGKTWDAVVIAPLEHGLIALDALALPQDEGYVVFADYRRHELIVFVRPGTTADGCADIQGVRTLSNGSWLLVPRADGGNWEAACLSRSTAVLPRYVDPVKLRTALLKVGEELGAHACAR